MNPRRPRHDQPFSHSEVPGLPGAPEPDEPPTVVHAVDWHERPDQAAEHGEVLLPLAGRSWTDRSGSVWTRRGHDVPRLRVRRLLDDQDVRVVGVTADGLRDVPENARPALWEHIEPRLRDAPRAPGDHLDVLVGEFRSASGARLLVVEERC